MRQRHLGFTLIELVAVLVIVSILAAISVSKFINTSTQASQASLLGFAAALTAGSHANFAARKAGNASAITINQTSVCTYSVLSRVFQDNQFPNNYAVNGSGDCSDPATVSVSCNAYDYTTGMSAPTPIYCAR